MKIMIPETDEEVLACFPIMHVLRPHLRREDFVGKVARQRGGGYRLATAVAGGEVCALAGYRVHEFMAWGKVLYIDDLATDPEKMRKGYAGALLDWLDKEAAALSCDQIHLDSGYGRQDAHRLYLNKGFVLSSHHFAKMVSGG